MTRRKFDPSLLNEHLRKLSLNNALDDVSPEVLERQRITALSIRFLLRELSVQLQELAELSNLDTREMAELIESELLPMERTLMSMFAQRRTLNSISPTWLSILSFDGVEITEKRLFTIIPGRGIIEVE